MMTTSPSNTTTQDEKIMGMRLTITSLKRRLIKANEDIEELKRRIAATATTSSVLQAAPVVAVAPAPPPVTPFQRNNNNSNNPTLREEDVEEDHDDIQRATEKNVLVASKHVASILAEPAGTRGDLNVHTVGRKARDLASSNDEEKLRHLLLANREVVGMRCADSAYTLLHVAAKKGSTEVCRLLIEEFACDPFATDFLGRTPLHLAAEEHRKETCEYLISDNRIPLGAEAPRDMAGLTPAAVSSKKSIATHGLNNEKKKELTMNQRSVSNLLHKYGDPCVSPFPKKAPLRAARTGGGRENVAGGLVRSRLGLNVTNSVAAPLSIHSMGGAEEDWFAMCEMPGWRVAMEDVTFSHRTKNGEIQVLCVFDGHGGKTAARRCASILGSIVDSELESALSSSFTLDAPSFLSRLASRVVSQMDVRLQSNFEEFKIKRVETPGMSSSSKPTITYETSDKSGTTCVLALAPLLPLRSLVEPPKTANEKNSIVIANVGDSRASLINLTRPSGSRRITIDHKLKQYPPPGEFDEYGERVREFLEKERERIVQSGGIVLTDETNHQETGYVVCEFGDVDPTVGTASTTTADAMELTGEEDDGERNGKKKKKLQLAMTRTLGNVDGKRVFIGEPDVFSADFGGGDDGRETLMLVMASDGIWDVMDEVTMAEFLKAQTGAGEGGGNADDTPSLFELGNAICKRCFELGSQDNMSVVIVDGSAYLRRIDANGEDELSASVVRRLNLSGGR